MKYCCSSIERDLARCNEDKTKNHSILYDAYWRKYFIIYIDNDRDEECLREISNCPFCGTKLPSPLADKWFDVLEEEYGITDPRNDDADKVPPEFRTDEWWKKRGL